jgi:Flp pilus assembly protein TadD
VTFIHRRYTLITWSVVAASLSLPGQTRPSSGRQPAAAPAARSPIAKNVLEAEDAIAKRDFARAESLLVEATTKTPSDYRAWYDLGFVLNALNRRNEAIGAFRKAVTLKADEPETNLALGQLLLLTGQHAEAAKYLAQATKLKPSASAWLLLGQALEPTDAPRAISAYQRAATASPNDPEPHMRLGALFERQKAFADAEAAYKTVVQLDPKSSEAVAGLANVYLAQDRIEDAETALRTFVALEPNDVRARIQLGRLLARRGKVEDAIQMLEAAAVSAPDPKLSRELGNLYLFAKKPDKAAAAFQATLPQMERDAETQYGLGTALLQLTRYAEAEPALINAIKLDPKLVDAYANLALAASNNKHYQLAIKALDARASLAPDSPATYFLRATCYDNLRMFKEAAKNYRQFLEVAGGRFADQEWQAKHRLIAIDPEAKR